MAGVAGAGLSLAVAAIAARVGAPAAPGTGPVVLYGPADGLSGVGGGTRPVVAVPGWAYGPGQAAFQAACAADGTVITGTTPFSDNQTEPTSDGMELGVFEPDRERFTRLRIPSTTGRLALPSPDPRYGGAGGGDVSDVIAVAAPDGGPGMMFLSSVAYFGWDGRAEGQLPTVGHLRRSGGAWAYDRSRSWTADELAAAAPSSFAGLAFPTDGFGPRQSRGPASAARLPRSGHTVVAQYFGSPMIGMNQGALLVIDDAGRPRAFWQYPAVTGAGRALTVNPREVVADPTSAAGDERFAVICDVGPAGAAVPFPVQEFSYSVGAGMIRPMSLPVLATADGTRMESACFDQAGTLFVARTRPDGLRAAPVAVYPKIGSERRLVSATPSPAVWAGHGWGAISPPDEFVTGSDVTGLVRSMVSDPATGAVIVAGLGGRALSLRAVGSGAGTRVKLGRSVDLGLGALRAHSTGNIGLRRAGLDAGRRLMWLPINQIVQERRRWPYPPFPLSQWLLRLELDSLIA